MSRNIQRERSARKKYNTEEERCNEEKAERGRATGLETEWKYNQSSAEGWEDQRMGATVIMES